MENQKYPKLSEFISEHYSEDEAANIRAVAQKEFAQLQAIQGRVQPDECILGLSTPNLPRRATVPATRKIIDKK